MAGYNAVTAEYQHDTRLFPQEIYGESPEYIIVTLGEF